MRDVTKQFEMLKQIRERLERGVADDRLLKPNEEREVVILLLKFAQILGILKE